MTTDARPAPFAMLGNPDAAACEGDACMVPSAPRPLESSTIQD